MPTLSEDIIVGHILTRLPVKSLLRFKYVCKSWNCILSNPDPQFITAHLTHTSRNPDHECLIMAMRYHTGPLSVHFPYQNHVDVLSRSRMSYSRMDNTPFYSNMVGSINGIVCLFYKHMFLLWNPVTCLGKTVSPPLHHVENEMWLNCERFYGFGLDHRVQEEAVGFKIVVCYNGRKSSSQGFVYASSTDSWSELVVPDHIYSYSLINFSTTPDIIVEGCPYWNTCRRTTNRFVFKFESGSHRFKKFLLPSQNVLGDFSFDNYILANLKECPALMVYSRGPVINVFHLDEECGVWSQTYTFGPICCHPGKLSQCFKYGGEIVFDHAKILYDPRTKWIKVIGYDYGEFNSAYSYTPSFVFLNGMEPLHAQSHWRSAAVNRPLRRRPTKSHARLLFRMLRKCL